MRHGNYTKKLGVKTAHRKAMLSNMANSLITHDKIKTTTARAKELQSRVEKLVTLAKKGDVHSRRQAFAVLRNKETVKKLFNELAQEFQNVNGGYTRRAFYGRRLGDGASLSVVEFNIEKKVVEEPKKKTKKKEAKTETTKTKSVSKKTTTKKKTTKTTKKAKTKKESDKE